MTQEAIIAMQEAWDNEEQAWREQYPELESRQVENRLAVYEPSVLGAWISSTDTVEVRQ